MVNSPLAWCLNSVLNVKVLVGTFNQEKALVGAFSVIVQLHRLIDLRHYSGYLARSSAARAEYSGPAPTPRPFKSSAKVPSTSVQRWLSQGPEISRSEKITISEFAVLTSPRPALQNNAITDSLRNVGAGLRCRPRAGLPRDHGWSAEPFNGNEISRVLLVYHRCTSIFIIFGMPSETLGVFGKV